MSRMSRWSWTLPLLALAGCGTDMTGVPNMANDAVAPVAPPISLAIASDPDEYPLYLSQAQLVGTVYVWNNLVNLFVKIDLDAGYCMMVSHVDAKSTKERIPQTKNGNPIPGKFAQAELYDPCEDEDTFTFALSGLGDNPVIAVHAKVRDEALSTVTIASNAGDLISTTNVYDGNWPTATAAVVPDFAAGAPWAVIAGAAYISNVVAADGPGINVWRRVTETLTLPTGVLPVGGTLTVNSDNYEFTTLNGVEIERDEPPSITGVTVENSLPDPGVTPYTWAYSKSVGFTPTVGANNFEFIFRNAIHTGDNPTGLSYKATASYYGNYGSAWGGENDFDGANWATYITYVVTQAIRTNQDNLGAKFVFGARGDRWLKFSAVSGTMGDLGDFRWYAGPTPAFTGDVITATVAASGVWTLLVHIPTDPSAAYSGCKVQFYVKAGTSGSLGSVEGWTWDGLGNADECADGTVDNSGAVYPAAPFPVLSGLIEEF